MSTEYPRSATPLAAEGRLALPGFTNRVLWKKIDGLAEAKRLGQDQGREEGREGR
jgi:hypothetical protein